MHKKFDKLKVGSDVVESNEFALLVRDLYRGCDPMSTVDAKLVGVAAARLERMQAEYESAVDVFNEMAFKYSPDVEGQMFAGPIMLNVSIVEFKKEGKDNV